MDGVPSSDIDNVKAPRPPVPAKLRSFVEKWWTTTDNLPDHQAAVVAARESQKTLFPAEFDRTDAYRGKVPLELRTRRDDRRVRTNLVYRNVLQTVAMTVPDDHGLRWDPIPQVGEPAVEQPAMPVPGAIPPPPNPIHKMAESLTPVVKQYCEEAGFQEVCQGWVQDACQYRLAIMKVVFDRDYITDTIKIHSEGMDVQENIQNLRVLVEDFERGVFNEQDQRFQEMEDIKEALGISDEIKLWKGLRVELVPIDCFKFDPAIRGYEQIYLSSWMSHDVMMSVDEIRAKYPYKPLGEDKWTGVYPGDLTNAHKGQAGDSPTDRSYFNNSREKGKGPTARPESRAEADRLMVREVWSKKLNRVFVLVEGLEYPAAEWVPEKTPKQWYPFRCLRLNRVTGQVYGFSDVELQAEMQHRINRKRSDEEKGRWLSLPRGIYNTQGIDEAEIRKMRDHNPGEWKGINLGTAKSVKEVMEFQQFDFDPAAFDTQADYGEMRAMASLPQELVGNSGADTKFASQVAAATQGAAIASNARGYLIRTALEGTYDMIAEILLQELEPKEAEEAGGPLTFWPHIYSDADGKKAMDEIQQQVQMEVQQGEQAAQMQSEQMNMQLMSQGLPPQPFVPMDEVAKDEATAQMTEQKCIEVFGWIEPLTREALFRRLKCKVTVALNTAADRQQRLQGIQALFASIQMGAQAAASAQMMFDPDPLLKQGAALFNMEEDALKKMFKPMSLMGMMAGPAPGQPGLPPEVAGASAPQEGAGGNINAPVNSPNTAISPVKAQGQNV